MKKKKVKLGDYVKAVRTWDDSSKWVKGTFRGFYLTNIENPDSVVGVVEVVTADGTSKCYDVYPDSIKPLEEHIVELVKHIQPRHIEALREAEIKYRGTNWSEPLADLLVILESLRSSL